MSAERRSDYLAAEDRFWRAVGATPIQHTVRLASTGTTVRVLEVGTGEPALFIHGGPNAGSTWVPLVGQLTGLRCLLVDRPGTGLSAPYPITVGNLPRIGAMLVAEILDGFAIERAHVVASSFGGHLALRSAAATPERFLRMVQMACPALSPGERVPPFLRMLTRPSVRRIVNALPPSERAARMILRQIGHGASLDARRIPQDFLDWYVALQRHTDTMVNDGDLIGRLIPRGDEVRLSDDLLRSITVPTLFWWGADDTFGGEAVASGFVATMPQAEFTMVPEAGHLPWLDDPEGAAAATLDFLGVGVEHR